MSKNLQDPIDPHTKTRNDGGAGGIGSVDVLFCNNCGTINPSQARFCTKCGQPLQTTGQMSSMQFGQGWSSLAYNAPVDLNPEASPATPLPSPDNEEATPLTVNQERTSTIPLVGSPDTSGAIPIIRNWLGGNTHDGWRRRIRSRRFITIALIVLFLLLVGSSLPFLVPYLHTILPASSATVTITPASQNFSKTYAISAVTGTPDVSQHQVQARLLSFTTKAQSKTVKATGQGHQDSTAATGSLTFTNASENTTIAAGQQISGASGVEIAIDNPFDLTVGGTTSVSAHAVNPGSGGNIPAYDINGAYAITQLGAQVGTVYIQNTSAFTGGQDASDYTYVQQSDIDNVANPLVSQLTPAARSAVQQQLRANERFVYYMSDPECTPNIKTNHQATDKATDVTVTVSVTCQGEVYDLQAFQAMATDLLKSDAASQLAGYALVGNVVIGVPIIVTIDGGTVYMNVDVQGVWVSQFGDSQKQSLAKLIAGKTQADASALLLEQRGIHKVSLTTSGGWGAALPAAENIKMVVLSVPDL
jgi:zinc-ribbon domain/Baseplate J-like protein